MPAVQMHGQRFGALVVLQRDGRQFRAAAWLCQCDCGQRIVARGDKLRQGRIKTCGIDGHRWYKHSLPGVTTQFHSEYASWEKMHSRCANKKSHRYNAYGARGIKVCARWKLFKNFLEDMGPKPTPQYTIERKENDGNYEPNNCRWATRQEQARNRRATIYVEHEGQRVTLMDLIEKLGVPRAALAGRLRLGWPLDEALATPVRKYRKKKK